MFEFIWMGPPSCLVSVDNDGDWIPRIAKWRTAACTLSERTTIMIDNVPRGQRFASLELMTRDESSNEMRLD